jgi:nucleoside-diphosphate-sugar epimerase
MGHSHVVPELLERTLNAPSGGDLRVRSSDHQRTFCYVSDAVEFIVRSASSPSCEGEVLNVGASSPEVRMDELAKLISDATDKRINIVPAPADVGSPTRRAPDMTRATELTGYRAQVSLEEGLASTTTWYSQRDANHA